MSGFHGALVIVALLAASSGCADAADPIGPGTLQVRWSVEPRGCGEAGVSSVTVFVTSPDETHRRTVDCAVGALDFDEIPGDNYRLHAEGSTEDGRTIYESPVQPLTVRPERVTQPAPLRLSASPATLSLAWRFADGRVCGARDVSTVEAIVYDEEDYELRSARFRCNAGDGLVGRLPAGRATVVAWGLDDQERVAAAGSAEITLERGEEDRAEVILGER